MLQFIRNPIVWMVGGALAALPALALAAGEAGQDIPITDPVLLESLGFAPDAANVYTTPQALEELRMSPEERAAVQQARYEEHRAVDESTPAGGPFGTDTVGYASVPAQAFHPDSSGPLAPGTVYTLGVVPDDDELACGGGIPFFVGTFSDLPHGAQLERVDFWLFDASDEGIGAFLIRTCQPDFAAGTTITTLLAGVTTPAAGGEGDGHFFVDGVDEDIDLQSCVYTARVRLDGSTLNCSELDDLRIQKVRVQWRRQISPPPASPTFDDVDEKHPFFQHIEALAASGITGGCRDGSDFCPGDPLTRGQMAVFLAKALGLHWGEISQ